MVSRRKCNVRDILHSESLNCYPPENQAAKIFATWMAAHPEFSVDDVDMCIESYEREEDYYGNGGGYDRYIRIFKRHEETDDEYNKRIAEEETACLNKFRGTLNRAISELIWDYDIYDCRISDEIKEHISRIEEAVMDTVKKKIKK